MHLVNCTVYFADEGEEFSEYSGSKFMARCFRCGSREIVIVVALASASLFIYDGIQVNHWLDPQSYQPVYAVSSNTASHSDPNCLIR